MTFLQVIEALLAARPGAPLGASVQPGGHYHDRAAALTNYQMHEGDPTRYSAAEENGRLMWVYVGRGDAIYCGDKSSE